MSNQANGPSVFTGEFQVEDDEFSLRAVRFILHENHVRAHLRFVGGEGMDSGEVDEDVPLVRAGVYACSNVPVRYDGTGRDFRASLVFTVIRPEDDVCVVEGQWKEAGDTWRLEARLRRFRPKEVQMEKDTDAYTEWFDAVDGEIPSVQGAYECRRECFEGEPTSGLEQRSFAYWDGIRFGPTRATPDEAFKARRAVEPAGVLSVVKSWRGYKKPSTSEKESSWA